MTTGAAEVDNRASGLRLYVLPLVMVGVKRRRAAELVEQDGDAAEVSVFAQRSHLRARRRRIGDAGLVSSYEIDPM